MEYDRLGAELQREAAREGDMYRVQEVLSDGVTGGAPPNPAQRGERGVGAGGKQGRQGRLAQDISDGISREGRTKVLPIKGGSGRAAMRATMRVHFWHRHLWDTVVILEEDNLSHSR